MSKPLGPYTPAVRAGDFIFVSGQLGMADGSLANGVAALRVTGPTTAFATSRPATRHRPKTPMASSTQRDR